MDIELFISVAYTVVMSFTACYIVGYIIHLIKNLIQYIKCKQK